MHIRRPTIAAATLTAGLLLAGCAGSTTATTPSGSDPAAASAAENVAYATDLSDWTTTMQVHLTAFADDMGDYDVEGGLADVDLLQDDSADGRALLADCPWPEVKTALSSALDDYDTAFHLTELGLTTLDPDTIGEATVSMNDAGDHIEAATALIAEMQ